MLPEKDLNGFDKGLGVVLLLFLECAANLGTLGGAAQSPPLLGLHGISGNDSSGTVA